MNICEIVSRSLRLYFVGRSMKLSFLEASRREMEGLARRKVMDFDEPMKRNVHSGGIREVICMRRAGRWGRGRVSTINATFWGSKGDAGGGHCGAGGGVVG